MVQEECQKILELFRSLLYFIKVCLQLQESFCLSDWISLLELFEDLKYISTKRHHSCLAARFGASLGADSVDLLRVPEEVILALEVQV